MTWDEFLSDAAGARPEVAFADNDRPVLALDDRLPEGCRGLALNKKGTDNPLNAAKPSVLRLVRDLTFPIDGGVPADLRGFADLADRMRLHVADASPDSVVSALFFAARQSGVVVPEEIWELWLGPITRWEETGNAARPESSWPALASALAHRHYGAPNASDHQPTEEVEQAWRRVMPFAVEAMRAGYDPDDVPPDAPGDHLADARAALAEERARYLRKVFAAERHQLSLPVSDAPRRRLVDALFTREAELAGAMKVFARNDADSAPLGQGFTFMLVERPELKDAVPDAWMTASVDPRAGVHLYDLWAELERRETKAWELAGRQRPLFNPETSRGISSIEPLNRRFHEPWYIDPSHTLVASPKRQVSEGANEEEAASAPGSLLTTEAVHDAVFAVFDPLAAVRVRIRPQGTGTLAPDAADLVRLADVEPEVIDGAGKRVLAAWWPPEEPLPHPSGPVEPLPQAALRAMAARTLGVVSDRVLLDAPDLEEIALVSFGNGFAVVTDGGAFVLDAGRGGPSRVEAARDLVVRQAQLAAELDAIQEELAACAQRLTDDLSTCDSSGAAFRRQREFASLERRLIDARGTLDLPLSSDEAGLGPLKDALSRRWNIRDRLHELASEVAALGASSRTAEELRVYRVGRWAAGLGLGFLAADALVNPLTAALGLEGVLGGWEALALFVTTVVVSVVAAFAGARWLRGRVGG